jgi:hypothetical protein
MDSSKLSRAKAITPPPPPPANFPRAPIGSTAVQPIPCISCPKCGTLIPLPEVSKSQPAFAQQIVVGTHPRVQAIEQTGKFWKFIQLASVLLIIISFIFIMIGANSTPKDIPVWSIVGIVLGLPMFILGRLGAWWFHG